MLKNLKLSSDPVRSEHPLQTVLHVYCDVHFCDMHPPKLGTRRLRAARLGGYAMTLIAVPIRAFATDSRGFARIREDSRRIRGWIYIDSQMDIR